MKLCLACHRSFSASDWRCPACGHEPRCVDGVFSFAQPEDGDGFRAEFFADLAALEEGHFWFRARNRLIQGALARFFPAARSFLEVGCGTGYVLAGLAQRFPALQLSGSEYFAAGLPFAATRVPRATLYQMDARALPFVDEFDVIGAFDVLEHIRDDDAALRALAGAVRPGGGLILTVPQHRWLWSATDAYACHERRYERRVMLDKLRAAGLRIDYATSFVSLLLPAMVLSRQRTDAAGEGHDPLAELRLSPAMNGLCSAVMGAEYGLLRCGMRLPLGGSLLVVATKDEEAKGSHNE